MHVKKQNSVEKQDLKKIIVKKRSNSKLTLPMANSKLPPVNNFVLWTGDSIKLDFRTQKQLRWALQKGIEK